VDITTPASPRIVGGVGTRDAAVGVAVSVGYTYVKEEFSGLEVVDVTVPASPRIVGRVDTPGNAVGVAVSDSYAYVTDNASGLHVVPTQCPIVPVFLASFTLTRSEDGVEVRWLVRDGGSAAEFRLNASRSGKRWAIPVDAQSDPRYVAFDRSPELTEGGVATYQLMYLDSARGWIVLAEQSIALEASPWTTALQAPYPNPANSM